MKGGLHEHRYHTIVELLETVQQLFVGFEGSSEEYYQKKGVQDLCTDKAD